MAHMYICKWSFSEGHNGVSWSSGYEEYVLNNGNLCSMKFLYLSRLKIEQNSLKMIIKWLSDYNSQHGEYTDTTLIDNSTVKNIDRNWQNYIITIPQLRLNETINTLNVSDL